MSTSKFIDNLGDVEILGLTMIGESRGESIAGMVAVANVIRNRVRNSFSDYKAICLAPKQFSCWNDNDPNRILLEELAEKLINGQNLEEPVYKQIMFLASGIVANILLDNTRGATNYLTNDLFFSDKKPKWALKAVNLKTIGNQIFFNV